MGVSTQAMFKYPSSIVVDMEFIYVCDRGNHKIRRISKQGFVETIAGSSEGYVDGIGTEAKFSFPSCIAIDANKNIFVTDKNNHRIRKITPPGKVSTIAGCGIAGKMNGSASTAQFNFPLGITLDGNGNIYVADNFNHQIRKISKSGIVSTIAGSTEGFCDGIGTHAKFFSPHDIKIDLDGNLLVADYYNHRIRCVTAEGVVSTVGGSKQGYANGPIGSALFNCPFGIGVDLAGNILVSDTHQIIRKIS